MTEFWNEFYKDNFNFTQENSDFSIWVYNYLQENKNLNSLVDIGCGNGRDSIFFNKLGFNVICLDSSITSINKIKKIGINSKCFNLLEFDYSNIDILYCRFVLHTLSNEEINKFFQKISYDVKKESLFFIETRISEKNEGLVEFDSVVGKPHKRNIFNKEFIKDILYKYNLKIVLEKEGKGLSKFKGEDPTILRLVISK